MAIGLDFGNPCKSRKLPTTGTLIKHIYSTVVCIELHTPPVFQRERFNRTLTGLDWQDNRKYRQRLDSLDPGHAVVAPYAHQMRIILHEQEDLDKFRHLCTVAGIPRPFLTTVEAFSKGFYSSRNMYNIQQKLVQFSWPVAFQIEAMIRNGLVNVDDFELLLYEPIQALCQRDPRNAADTLRFYTEALRTHNPHPKELRQRFDEVCRREKKATTSNLGSGNFLCHHVTVTPTRMLLEGPYPIQSNRVIREYEGYGENFVRVDFRDEDRLQYRWERDVSSLLVALVFLLTPFSSSDGWYHSPRNTCWRDLEERT